MLVKLGSGNELGSLLGTLYACLLNRRLLGTGAGSGGGYNGKEGEGEGERGTCG